MADTDLNPFRVDTADVSAGEYRADASALYNALTGMGMDSADNSRATQVGYGRRINKIGLEELYCSSWLVQRACTAHIMSGTRRWVEVKLGGDDNPDPKIIDNFNKYVKKLKFRESVMRLGTWSRIYGGAGGVMVIEDGQPASEPLNEDKIQKIRAVEPLDNFHLRPDLTQDFNPLDPTRYELVLSRHYARKLNEIQEKGNRYVHNSRVLRFDGIEVPPDVMLRSSGNTYGWGQSMINLIYDSFTRYETINSGIANMVASFDVFVYTMNNLRALSSQEGGEEELKRRFQLIMLGLSSFRGLILDKDERAEFLTRNFSGLSEISESFRNDMIGATGIPHTVLFGESPSGLGATGESEQSTWAEAVNMYQEMELRPILERMFTLIWKAKDGPTKGKVPDDWSFEFKPLFVEKEEAIIQRRMTQSSIDSTYVGMEILLPEEVRISRFGGSEFSHETVLDEAAWKKKQDELAAESGGGFGDFDFNFGGGEEDGEAAGAEGAKGEEAPEDAGQAQLEEGGGDEIVPDPTQSPEIQKLIAGSQKKDSSEVRLDERAIARFINPNSAYGRRWKQLQASKRQ